MSEYAVDSGWLVEVVNEHTCGAGDGMYGHEPGCGLVPLASIDELLSQGVVIAAVQALADEPDSGSRRPLLLEHRPARTPRRPDRRRA